MNNQVKMAVVLQSLKEKSKRLLKKLKPDIKNKSDYEIERENLKTLNSFLKTAQAEKAKILDPLKEATKSVNELFAPFEQLIKNSIESSKANLISFSEKQNKELLKLEDKISSGKADVSKIADKIHDSKLSGQSSRFVAVIVDEKKIPRNYLVPDLKLITAALKEGKKVAGCELKEELSVTLR